jgi:hypothetical protein
VLKKLSKADIANRRPSDQNCLSGGGMQIDIDKIAAMNCYELLLGTVVPRPIALVTTISADGTISAAPYTLFNVMGHDPALAMISVLGHPDRRLKDTARKQSSGCLAQVSGLGCGLANTRYLFPYQATRRIVLSSNPSRNRACAKTRGSDCQQST